MRQAVDALLEFRDTRLARQKSRWATIRFEVGKLRFARKQARPIAARLYRNRIEYANCRGRDPAVDRVVSVPGLRVASLVFDAAFGNRRRRRTDKLRNICPRRGPVVEV